MTSTLDKRKIFGLLGLVLVLSSWASAEQSFIYPDEGSSQNFADEDWFRAPEYDTQQELLFEILAPFAFLVILLQMVFQKALRMTFAGDDDNPWRGENKPDVFREATMMSVAISAMLLASPYWTLMRKMAASIGLLSVGLLIMLFLYLAYLFMSGG